MTKHKIVAMAAMLAVTGTAMAGKTSVPGTGSGSGGVISSNSSAQAAFSSQLFASVGTPALFTRVSSLPGAEILPNGDVRSPPVRVGDRDVRLDINRSGQITNVITL